MDTIQHLWEASKPFGPIVLGMLAICGMMLAMKLFQKFLEWLERW